jgi:hypothetical protein
MTYVRPKRDEETTVMTVASSLPFYLSVRQYSIALK